MQKRWLGRMILAAVLLALPISANAADYNFDSSDNTDYYEF